MYAGLAPISWDSGRRQGHQIGSHRYHCGLRRLFSMSSFAALSRQRFNVLSACLRDKTSTSPYDQDQQRWRHAHSRRDSTDELSRTNALPAAGDPILRPEATAGSRWLKAALRQVLRLTGTRRFCSPAHEIAPSPCYPQLARSDCWLAEPILRVAWGSGCAGEVPGVRPG
ncbi:hypothetical protein [Micromonospora ureilytica]|uniref:hypothetical protein n=1 Tax=Micromonospora ureilytica TaxID=709868 RepID=UPI002E159E30|nr:hypothetical protein OHB55_08300 [Micromonospora ureilytica]